MGCNCGSGRRREGPVRGSAAVGAENFTVYGARGVPVFRSKNRQSAKGRLKRTPGGSCKDSAGNPC